MGRQNCSKLQTECGQDLPHKVQRAFRLGSGLANDDKVVSVTDEVETSCVKLPVEMIEDDVRQEGRNNTPLRRADCGRLEDTVLHHARPEKFLDETQDVAIRDFGGHRLHDDRLRQVIKEGLDIRIQDDAETLVVERQGLANSPVAIAALTKAVRRVVKQGFEDWVEEATNCLLSHPIANRGNTQWAQLRFVLRNVSPAQGKGSKEPFFKSRSKARRLSLRLASNILMLTLSIPAAPRLRLTDLKESSSNGRVILPVKEWTFCFLVLLIPIMIQNRRETSAELFENVS